MKPKYFSFANNNSIIKNRKPATNSIVKTLLAFYVATKELGNNKQYELIYNYTSSVIIVAKTKTTLTPL